MRAGTTQWFDRGRARRSASVATAALLATVALPAVAWLAATAGDGAQSSPGRQATAPKLPVVFEHNAGQAGSDVSFLARGTGLHLALSPTEARFTVGNAAKGDY